MVSARIRETQGKFCLRDSVADPLLTVVSRELEVEGVGLLDGSC